MKHVIITDYHEDDWPQIQEIILNAENFGKDFVQSEKTRITTCQKSPDFGKIILAREFDTNHVLGYTSIEYRWRSIGIYSIVIHHQWLRQGIGRRLIQEIIDIGKKKSNINVIRVDTGDFMIYAQKFYLACGFQFCGLLMHDLSWNNNQVHFALQVK